MAKTNDYQSANPCKVMPHVKLQKFIGYVLVITKYSINYYIISEFKLRYSARND